MIFDYLMRKIFQWLTDLDIKKLREFLEYSIQVIDELEKEGLEIKIDVRERKNGS